MSSQFFPFHYNYNCRTYKKKNCFCFQFESFATAQKCIRFSSNNHRIFFIDQLQAFLRAYNASYRDERRLNFCLFKNIPIECSTNCKPNETCYNELLYLCIFFFFHFLRLFFLVLFIVHDFLAFL